MNKGVVSSPPPEAPTDPAVALLVDRARISDVIMSYAATVDRRDWELLESCFVPDLKVAGWGGREFADRQALVEFIKGVAHYHTTMHTMGNQFVEVDGDDACLESYAMLTHHGFDASGGPREMNRSDALYVEKLHRSPNGWIITQRGGPPVWALTGVTEVSSDDPTVRRLLARAEIHDLMMSYALGIDQRDYQRIAACFADPFEAAYGPRHFTDLESLLRFIGGVENFASTTHFLGQQVTELNDEEAFVLTYAMVTHRPKGASGAGEWTAGGPSYRDRMTKENGRWRIAQRGEPVRWSPARRSLALPSATPVVQWLLDRAEISELVATAALATDTADWELLRGCLADDFEATVINNRFADQSAYIDHLMSASSPGHRSCHFLGNQLIDLSPPEACVETYAYVTARPGEGQPLSPWSRGACRLVDEVRLVEDTWYITRRSVETNEVKASDA